MGDPAWLHWWWNLTAYSPRPIFANWYHSIWLPRNLCCQFHDNYFNYGYGVNEIQYDKMLYIDCASAQIWRKCKGRGETNKKLKMWYYIELWLKLDSHVRVPCCVCEDWAWWCSERKLQFTNLLKLQFTKLQFTNFWGLDKLRITNSWREDWELDNEKKGYSS